MILYNYGIIIGAIESAPILGAYIRSAKSMRISGKEESHAPCLLIIAYEIKYIEVFFAGRFTETAAKLL